MIPVYRAEGADITEGLRQGPGILSWARSLEAVDRLSALLPPHAAGGFRDRAGAALRDLPEATEGKCWSCYGVGCLACGWEGFRTINQYLHGPDPLDADAVADILTAIFEEHVTR
ncbi:hypothetical protein [Zavarzinia sp.]|uniref:hypothetical protein n=1 Tax=Zavarzinia sp. TaxID=2027920 RepID=UPI003BB69427